MYIIKIKILILISLILNYNNLYSPLHAEEANNLLQAQTPEVEAKTFRLKYLEKKVLDNKQECERLIITLERKIKEYEKRLTSLNLLQVRCAIGEENCKLFYNKYDKKTPYTIYCGSKKMNVQPDVMKKIVNSALEDKEWINVVKNGAIKSTRLDVKDIDKGQLSLLKELHPDWFYNNDHAPHKKKKEKEYSSSAMIMFGVILALVIPF